MFSNSFLIAYLEYHNLAKVRISSRLFSYITREREREGEREGRNLEEEELLGVILK